MVLSCCKNLFRQDCRFRFLFLLALCDRFEGGGFFGLRCFLRCLRGSGGSGGSGSSGSSGGFGSSGFGGLLSGSGIVSMSISSQSSGSIMTPPSF